MSIKANGPLVYIYILCWHICIFNMLILILIWSILCGCITFLLKINISLRFVLCYIYTDIKNIWIKMTNCGLYFVVLKSMLVGHLCSLDHSGLWIFYSLIQMSCTTTLRLRNPRMGTISNKHFGKIKGAITISLYNNSNDRSN